MMRQCAAALVLAASILMIGGEALPSVERARTFIEPARALAFELPASPWVAEPGFGDEIAVLVGRGRARIRVSWMRHSGRRDGVALGARASRAVPFEAAADRGALIAVPAGDGSVEIACTDDPKAFVETFLVCRALASSVRAAVFPEDAARAGSAASGDAALPTPEVLSALRRELAAAPSAGAAAKLSSLRQRFADLDGRAGCAGVSMLPRSSGASASLDQAMRLEQEGRRESARGIYGALAKGDRGFFPLLFLARMALEEEEGGAATKWLARAASMESPGAERSLLLAALRIWKARVEGKTEEARVLYEDRFRMACGSVGAVASFELGLAEAAQDPARAAERFEAAIAADPAFVPAYLALGRALLDQGVGAAGAEAKMSSLLRHAPQVSGLAELRRRFERFRPRGSVLRSGRSGRSAGVQGAGRHVN
jgi:hypothetical protein